MGRGMAPRTKKTAELPTASADFPSDYWEHTLASLEEGIIIIDREERIAFFNPTAQHLTGLPYAQVWHKPYTQAFAVNSWVVKIVQRTLVSGHSRTAGAGELPSRSRRSAPGPTTCSPLLNAECARWRLPPGLPDASHLPAS